MQQKLIKNSTHQMNINIIVPVTVWDPTYREALEKGINKYRTACIMDNMTTKCNTEKSAERCYLVIHKGLYQFHRLKRT